MTKQVLVLVMVLLVGTPQVSSVRPHIKNAFEGLKEPIQEPAPALHPDDKDKDPDEEDDNEAQVERKGGTDCWLHCGKKAGKCTFCGSHGACCSQHWVSNLMHENPPICKNVPKSQYDTNTSFPRAHQCVPQAFRVGQAGSNKCPPEYYPIFDQEACEAAALALYNQAHVDQAAVPARSAVCFTVPRENVDTVSFNKTEGKYRTSISPDSKIVCKLKRRRKSGEPSTLGVLRYIVR